MAVKKRAALRQVPRDTPRPPADLSPLGVETWDAIVGGYPADHFAGANLLILEQLCRARCMAADCDRIIASTGLLTESGAANPAVAMRTAAWSSIRGCATKLRLSINATRESNSADARPDPTAAMAMPWDWKRKS